MELTLRLESAAAAAAAAAVTSSVPAGSPAHRTTTSVPHTHRHAHIHHARGHPPQCSRGVSTQVLAECTPKNQSLLVLTRARGSYQTEVAKNKKPAQSAPPRERVKQRSTPGPAWSLDLHLALGTWVRRVVHFLFLRAPSFVNNTNRWSLATVTYTHTHTPHRTRQPTAPRPPPPSATGTQSVGWKEMRRWNSPEERSEQTRMS